MYKPKRSIQREIYDIDDLKERVLLEQKMFMKYLGIPKDKNLS